MSKIIPLVRPALNHFCQFCIDEKACYEAGRCLYDAEHAKARESAPVIKHPRYPK